MKNRSSVHEHPLTDATADGVKVGGLPADVSKDWLASFLLLCIKDGGSYAHEMEEGVEDIGFHGVRPGEAYWILRGMEEEGMVATVEDGLGLPSRRYGITESGRAYLEFRANLLEEHRRTTDLFLYAYERRNGGGHRG